MYIDFYNPISYNTDVTSLVYNYNTRNMGLFGQNYYFFGGSNNNSIWNNTNTWFSAFNSLFNNNLFGGNNIFFGNNMTFGNNFFGNNMFFGSSNPFSNMNSGSVWMYPTYHFYGTGSKGTTTSSSSSASPSSSISSTSSSTKASETSQKQKVEEKEKTQAKVHKQEAHKTSIGKSLAYDASKYLGYNEADGSSKRFSDSGEWCADFVTFVVNETYAQKGLKPPAGFGNHRVENLKQWGIKNNKYLPIAGKSNKADIIKNHVKIGDIMILRENGASHTGFVSKINDDGSFETIEGNRNDKVVRHTYSPNDNELSGFVRVG